MIRSYLKIALRTLHKQKATSAVTIGSLAAGLACCLLLFLYVRHEWTYDRFHPGAGRIRRVVGVEALPSGERVRTARTKIAVGPLLAETMPAVEAAVRFAQTDAAVTVGAQTFDDESVTLADSSLLAVFGGFHLQRGDAQTALARPGGALLTEATARRFFGTTEGVLGRRFTVDFDDRPLEATVTGLLEAPPEESSLPVGVVLPFDALQHDYPAAYWGPISQSLPIAETYLRLSATTDVQALEERLNALLDERAVGDDDVTVVGRNEAAGFALQPLTQVHLDPSVTGGLTPTSDPLYAYLLTGIALVVLLLACINFMTLSLGRSAGRAREVGIRKTVGARREQVALQFWGEAFLTTGGALVLGLALARAALPAFNRLTGQALTLSLGRPSLWMALAALVAVVGLVAGGYPALVLSGFAPAAVLRGSGGRLGGRSRLARGLVVVQFTLSIALVAGVLIMSQQLGYLTDRSVNADAGQIVRIAGGADAAGGVAEGARFYERFRQEALRQSGVEAVAGAWQPFPGETTHNNLTLGDTAKVRTYTNNVNADFPDMMGVDLVAGRGLGEGASTGNLQPVLVNQALVRAMGWASPEAAVGQSLPLEAFIANGADQREGAEVVGVLEDFPFQTLRTNVAPLMLAPLGEAISPANALYVRFRAGQTAEVLASLQDVWHRTAAAEAPFEYVFLDDAVRQQYEAERRWRALVSYAAALALLISCAGLFGLALLSVQRRQKEIGIRKVLGASAASVVGLVTRQFAWLVAAGFALAVPLAWLGARRWLQTFAFRIDLGAGPFLAAGAAVLVVALATVGWQAGRAARANPAEALRDE